jgi:hypothetical protein
LSVVVDDANSYTTTGAGGGVWKLGYMTPGKNYAIAFEGSTSASSCSINQTPDPSTTRIEIGALGGVYFFTATYTGLYLRNVGAGTTNITKFELYEVTDQDTTYIDTQYPATGTGKVEEIEVNLAVNGNSLKVGCGRKHIWQNF